MQVNEFVALIDAVSGNDIQHFEYLTGHEHVTISKRMSDTPGFSGWQPMVGRTEIATNMSPCEADETSMGSPTVANTQVGQESNNKQEPETDEALFAVTAPCVGTVMLNQIETGEPIVSVGDAVKNGQLLFVIEAMKLFTDVTAPISGRVAQICVSLRETVEFGTVIMKIEKGE